MTLIAERDAWRSRCIEAETETMNAGRLTLGVRALIAQAQAGGHGTVSTADLLTMLGPLPEPNSVAEWAARGRLPDLIARLAPGTAP